MELIAIGLNHKTAPIEIREKLAFSDAEIEKALWQAQGLPSLNENMILSTCNRVEIYAASRMTENAVFELKDFLSKYHGLSLKEFETASIALLEKRRSGISSGSPQASIRWLWVSPRSWARSNLPTEIATQAKTSGYSSKLLHRALSPKG
jgi:hypothetical protein